jgi:hypothetical protein
MKSNKLMAVVLLSFVILGVASVAAIKISDGNFASIKLGSDQAKPIPQAFDSVEALEFETGSNVAAPFDSIPAEVVDAITNVEVEKPILVDFSDSSFITSASPTDLREMVPPYQTIEDLVTQCPNGSSKLDCSNGYLFFTNDGKNLMWGRYGNGYFVGQDSEGNRVWGMYIVGMMFGFNNEEYFYGIYWGSEENIYTGNGPGYWSSNNMFGNDMHYDGRVVLFP